MKHITKILSLLLALTMLLCFPVAVSAAELEDAPIDESRTGSLTIYKYDLTNAEKDGVWDSSYVSTGVFNQTGVNEATVSIQFSGLSTREYTVDNFEAINVPEGMEVEIINASLTVRVRGAAGQISQLTGDDIKVVVDFSNAVAGTATYKASITFGEEFTAVGAVMGPYSVSATVKG